MKVKELITKLLDLPRDADISVTTKINGENISYPIKECDIDLSYSHIIFDNYGTLELKGENRE